MSEIKINATASALDMCRDHGIDPAAVHCPAGELLTQPMVQRFRDGTVAAAPILPAAPADNLSDESDKSDKSDNLPPAETAVAESAVGLTLMPKPKAKKK